jgi:hypothetical protein
VARRKNRWERVGAKKEGHAPEPVEAQVPETLSPMDLPLVVFWRSCRQLLEAGWRLAYHYDGENELMAHLVPFVEPNRFTLLLEKAEEDFPGSYPVAEGSKGSRLARVVAGETL